MKKEKNKNKTKQSKTKKQTSKKTLREHRGAFIMTSIIVMVFFNSLQIIVL